MESFHVRFLSLLHSAHTVSSDDVAQSTDTDSGEFLSSQSEFVFENLSTFDDYFPSWNFNHIILNIHHLFILNIGDRSIARLTRFIMIFAEYLPLMPKDLGLK